ncbi:uncharacterized protein EHS24_007080 [Apiotrichum porosum]|uniref:TauD/TfdA-like domain-containing protein n=1 Tax=Apiotrichum porosum TaxID=105984 RepID=A0A427XWX4_9TREE|nr:uncharacterized protein EHS24_007080 [Apiotrichum porosum]RSH83396.1 hypothetical protein EHS24_007080 [Apiotrichum porosum]
MAPIALDTPAEPQVHPVEALKAAAAAREVDLRQFALFDSTPAIGTEFLSVSTDGRPVLTIKEVLQSPAQIAALGRLVSERGVVFFRKAGITPEEQKVLVQSLGTATGKPAESGLHTHPLTLPGSQYGDEITHISNQHILSKEFTLSEHSKSYQRVRAKSGWHTDITFERVPSDYASLIIRTLPPGGGDTLWASAYEAYDRLSPVFQKYLEGLTATHRGSIFLELSQSTGLKLRDVRGHPDNNNDDLTTTHPVIRTNPVTGWKGLFVNSGFTIRINELTVPESDWLLNFLFDHIADNHDIQVRFRWEEDSLAIWDNRSTFHTATNDVGPHLREGTRSVSLGEKPFFDPNSKSRRADLADKAEAAAAVEAK